VTYGILANQRFEFSNFTGFSVGVRSDFSSAFGSGATAQTFPRGDFFLTLSNLKFWQDSKISNVISEIKLRAGYGEAGIQPGAFQRFTVLGAANLGGGSVFTFPTTNPNPNLSVELSKELEYGTDMTLTLGKGQWFKTANISATLWERETANAIYRVDAAPSTGVGGKLDTAFGLKEIANLDIVLFSVVSSLMTPTAGVLMAAIAKNKIVGFALIKSGGILFMIPLLILLDGFSDWKQFILGLAPNFWAVKGFYNLALQLEGTYDLSFGLYLLIGSIYLIIIATLSIRWFVKRVSADRSA
jgi:hypothetical protein